MSYKYASIAFVFVFTLSAVAGGQKQLKDYLTNLPFPMQEIREPQFPELIVSIVDYGAIADGHTLNTRAFNDAITACAKAGGGTVVVPSGTWITGPIKIESNVNLHVEKGALVQFSRKIEDFPFIAGFSGKSRRYIITPPIYAYKAKNIAITGDGVFDGSGEVWRYVKKIDMTDTQWKALVASGGIVTPDGKQWWPSKEAMEGERYLSESEKLNKELSEADFKKTREYLRPNLVHIEQCNDILLDGPTFENSPKFNIIPSHCENVIIRNVKVLAPEYGQNTDGIDPRSCRNVVIYNCTVNVGDDGICLKPSTIAESQTPGPSCQNIIIADCIVYKAHGGFVIGSESYGGVCNVSVRNCLFIGTDVGLRFKSARDRGGLVEKVFIDGIQMLGIRTDAILFDMYYTGGSPEAEATKNLTLRKAEPVNDMTPQFRDFHVRNIVCNGADRAIVINGLPEMSINNIVLDNVSISSKRGAYIADADSVQLNNCRIVPQSGAVINVIQSRNITINGGTYPAASDVFLKVTGEKSAQIRLIGPEFKNVKKAIELDTNVKLDAVKQ
ncbi:MAG: glycoside hydrolase family 28 protein [Bacteroidota bacterium]